MSRPAPAPGGAELTGPVIRRCPARPRRRLRLVPAGRDRSLPAILDGAPTTLRHPRLRAPFEIFAASAAGFRAALGTLGFTEIHTPKIVESARR